MTRPAHPRRRTGVLSRADLLEALCSHPDLEWFDLPPLVHGGPADTPGYERSSLEPEGQFLIAPGHEPSREEGPAPELDAARNERLRAPSLWRVQVRDVTPDSVDAEAFEDGPAPLQGVALARPSPEDATRLARQLWDEGLPTQAGAVRAALDRSLAARPEALWREPIHWHAVVRRVASGRGFDPLPRRRQHRWPRDVMVVLDRRRDSLEPFVRDMDAWASKLRHLLGGRTVQVRVLANDPTAPHQAWHRDRDVEEHGQDGQPWSACLGRTLVVVSDLAVASDAPVELQAAFEAWRQQLARQGTRLEVWTPAPVALHTILPHTLRVHPWGSHHAPRGARADDVLGSDNQALMTLLALMAFIGPASDVLVRALAARVAPGGLDRGLVWCAWNHPHAQRALQCCEIRPEFRARYEARAAQLPLDLLVAAHEDRRRLRAQSPDADEHLAVLRACALAPALAEHLSAARTAALHYLRETLPAQLRAPDNSALSTERARAQMLVWMAHPEVRRAWQHDFQRLQSLAWAEALRRGEAAPVHEELGPVTLDRADVDGDDLLPPMRWALVQRGPKLHLQANDAGLLRGVIWQFGQALALARDMSVRIGPWSVMRPLVPAGVEVADLRNADGAVQLHLGPCRLEVERLTRPAWAESWSQERAGVQVDLPTPWGETYSVPWPPVARTMPFKTNRDQSVRIDCGTDHYGVRASLVVASGVEQTLRYIPPGTFLMGSPAGTGDTDENPQHPVTLTQGFWLADTLCTQALWQTVMGDNPSHFKGGPDLPVDSVSWDMIQAFLQHLNEQLPSGCRAELPLEAQWEYACRAGTPSEYWWGDEMDTRRANVRESGLEKSTAVKAYDPNPWGLHDMHGNLWEWCADAKRSYADQPQVDPTGGTEGDARALRGGAWHDGAAGARSASRHVFHRGYGWDSSGFRFLLRSQAQPGPGGQGELASGNQKARAVRPAEPGVAGGAGRGAGRKSMVSRFKELLKGSPK